MSSFVSELDLKWKRKHTFLPYEVVTFYNLMLETILKSVGRNELAAESLITDWQSQ